MIIGFYEVSGFFLLLGGVYMFCSVRKHVLTSFIYVEYVAISVFLLFFFAVFMGLGSGVVLVYFLIFVVSESSVGLSVVLCGVRGRGREYVSSFSFGKC